VKNTNSAHLTNLIFKAKLLVFLRKKLSLSNGKILEQIGKNYGDDALLNHYLTLLNLRSSNLAQEIVDLYLESQAVANAHSYNQFVTPSIKMSESTFTDHLKAFFSNLVPGKKDSNALLHTDSSKKANRKLANKQALTHSFSTLSAPIINDLVTIQVWNKIKEHFSPDEQNEWKQKLSNDPQAFEQLQTQYERRSKKSLKTISQDTHNEVVSWLAKILIGSVNQTAKMSKSGKNQELLKLLENQDYAGLASFHLNQQLE